MRSGSRRTRSRTADKNRPAKRRPGCGNVELLSWRRRLEEPTPTLGTNPTRVPFPPKIPRPRRSRHGEWARRLLSVGRSETHAGGNHNRYRTGFGQESSVYTEAIEGRL